MVHITYIHILITFLMAILSSVFSKTVLKQAHVYVGVQRINFSNIHLYDAKRGYMTT